MRVGKCAERLPIVAQRRADIESAIPAMKAPCRGAMLALSTQLDVDEHQATEDAP
jgi:hypothetical protein